MFRFVKKSATGLVLLLSLSGCSTSEESIASLSCSAYGSLSTGSASDANATLSMTNLTVSILNGSDGPYSILLPGGSTVSTAATSYTYTGTVAVTTGSSGGITSTVTVTDDSTSRSATCTITGTSLTSSSSSIYVTASPSTSVTVGTSVTLTASSTDGVTSPTFTFSLSNQTTGLSLSQTSSNTAVVTSTVATTATVLVTRYDTTGGTSSASTQTTLYFGTGSSTGTSSAYVQLSASPSTTVAVGSTLTLTAVSSGISDPYFVFNQLAPFDTSVTAYSPSNGILYVTSNYATTLNFQVTVTSLSNSANQAVAQTTVQFVGSTTASSLTCQLLLSSSWAYVGNQIVGTLASNTGESLLVTHWDAGEPWAYLPAFPLQPPLGISYDYPGSKSMRVWARSATRPDVWCNGGSPLTGTVYVY